MTLDTGTTVDLISNKLANTLGCKVRRDTRQYRIIGVEKKELKIVKLETGKIVRKQGSDGRTKRKR